MSTHKPSAWASACIWGEQAPSHPRLRFIEQSLVPVIVRIARPEKEEPNSKQNRRNNKLSKLFGCFRASSTKDSDIKVIRMPRSEYLKCFARDKDNFYVGTEPERKWTVEELEEEFGIYQDLLPPLWSVIESEGKVFIEDVGEWDEKKGLKCLS